MPSTRTAARTITSTLPFNVAEVYELAGRERAALRLVHGSSDDGLAFVHRARMPGAISTVGASLGCDWTVRAAGVPSVAFALREERGTLSICPAPDAHVFVDGRRELPVWRTLRAGSRIDVGLLRLEVVTSRELSEHASMEPIDVEIDAEAEPVPSSHGTSTVRAVTAAATQRIAVAPSQPSYEQGMSRATAVGAGPVAMPEGLAAAEASGALLSPSILGAEEDARPTLMRMPTRFPWMIVAALAASAVLYPVLLSVLD